MQFYISVENLEMVIIKLKTTVRISPPSDEPRSFGKGDGILT